MEPPPQPAVRTRAALRLPLASKILHRSRQRSIRSNRKVLEDKDRIFTIFRLRRLASQGRHRARGVFRFIELHSSDIPL
jgi:hypothetical protein